MSKETTETDESGVERMLSVLRGLIEKCSDEEILYLHASHELQVTFRSSPQVWALFEPLWAARLVKAQEVLGPAIVRAATLEICHCGRHGHVLLDDGFAGPPFVSVPMGKRVIESGASWQRYSRETGDRLLTELRATALPTKFAELTEEQRRLEFAAVAFTAQKVEDMRAGKMTTTDEHAWFAEEMDRLTNLLTLPEDFVESLHEQFKLFEDA